MSNHPASARMRVPRGVELAAAACARSARRQVSGLVMQGFLAAPRRRTLVTGLEDVSGARRASAAASEVSHGPARLRSLKLDLRGGDGA